MDLVGLVLRITEAVTNIDSGQKGFAIRGKEQEGRISFEDGIAEAMIAFKEAQLTADPYIIFVAEYAFLTQEFNLCPKADTNGLNSVSKAIQDFDNAFIILPIVENSLQYQIVNKAFPYKEGFEVKSKALGSLPKDAFHTACGGHKTRINNTLKVIGIDPIEKTLLKQRFDNVGTALNGYIAKQKKSLSN